MDPALRDELRAEVDDVWAEAIRHLPLVGGAPDGARMVREFLGVLRTGDRTLERPDFGRGNQTRSAEMADGGYLRVSRAAWPDLMLRKGDKLVALARDGQPVFEVLAVDDRSHLRLICELGDAT